MTTFFINYYKIKSDYSKNKTLFEYNLHFSFILFFFKCPLIGINFFFYLDWSPIFVLLNIGEWSVPFSLLIVLLQKQHVLLLLCHPINENNCIIYFLDSFSHPICFLDIYWLYLRMGVWSVVPRVNLLLIVTIGSFPYGKQTNPS